MTGNAEQVDSIGGGCGWVKRRCVCMQAVGCAARGVWGGEWMYSTTYTGSYVVSKWVR